MCFDTRSSTAQMTDPDNDADWLFHIAKKEQPLAVNITTAPLIYGEQSL